MRLAYDGSAYFGWQVQPEQVSVQATLENALGTLLGTLTAVTGAGRTDTGVHASEYYAHFEIDPEVLSSKEDWRKQPDGEQFLFKLNRFLPPDIVVYEIFRVKGDMHARFSALSRSYEYRISTRKPVYERNYSHYIYGSLDVASIESCCRIIEATGDFESFARLHSDVRNHICKVEHAHWRQVEGGYIFEIMANRFLRNMVRSLVGSLIDVGMSRSSVKDFQEIVDARDRSRAGQSAPAKGLFLCGVEYPPDLRSEAESLDL